ncbi:MAG: hypothetical protein COB65_11285 [Thalassobium sp.]|nr:MAG: hypothetical protein COB65_11285 [Thalassobium sp.]
MDFPTFEPAPWIMIALVICPPLPSVLGAQVGRGKTMNAPTIIFDLPRSGSRLTCVPEMKNAAPSRGPRFHDTPNRLGGQDAGGR